MHPTAFVVHLPHARSFDMNGIPLQMPARYDKWTVPRALLAISAGQFVTQTARTRLLASGASTELAAKKSFDLGRAREREIIAFFKSQ